MSIGAQIFTGTAAAPEINCYTLNYLLSIVAPGQTPIWALSGDSAAYLQANERGTRYSGNSSFSLISLILPAYLNINIYSYFIIKQLYRPLRVQISHRDYPPFVMRIDTR